MRTNIYSEVDFIQGIKQLFFHSNIISISGESGTGKTTLALYLVGHLLVDKKPWEHSCIWIQAGEKFPFKRLSQMFQEQKEELDYITQNIFIIPNKNPISSYKEQSIIIDKILNPSTILPPSLKYIVIDNISHHLRFQLMQYSNITDVSSLLNTFYDTQLMPLILFCKRLGIVLILIHEVSFSPKDQCNKSFFYKLYDRIKTIDLVLNNIYQTNEKKLQITYSLLKLNFPYFIDEKGIKLR